MNFDEFENGCLRLIKWFKKNLDEYQIEQIFESVKYIPFEAWNGIVSKLIETTKPVASNFPTIGEIRQHWYLWRKENPHKRIAQIQKSECSDCDSIGILFFKVSVEGALTYQYAVKCGKCDNWRRHWGDNVPTATMTKEEILMRGWGLQRKVENPIGKPQKPINELTDGMLENIPRTPAKYEGRDQRDFDEI